MPVWALSKRIPTNGNDCSMKNWSNLQRTCGSRPVVLLADHSPSSPTHATNLVANRTSGIDNDRHIQRYYRQLRQLFYDPATSPRVLLYFGGGFRKGRLTA